MTQEEAIINIESDLKDATILAHETYIMTMSNIWEYAHDVINNFIKRFDINLSSDYKSLEIEKASRFELTNLVYSIIKQAFIIIMNKINQYDCLSDITYRKCIDKVLFNINYFENILTM